MPDLDGLEATEAVRLVGSANDGEETNPAQVSGNNELYVNDSLNNEGIDDVISVTAGTPVEVKIGASAKALRKDVWIQPLDGRIKLGWSLTTQSHLIFKRQNLFIAAGPATSVYIDAVIGTVQVAVSEVS